MQTPLRHALALSAALAFCAQQLSAQSPLPGPFFVTRPELEALATASEARAADRALGTRERDASADSARAYRERLRAGDFRVGDRLVVHLAGTVTLADTLTVTAARTVQLPEAGDVSLDGVLRSELEAKLREGMSRVVRGPEVRAQPLVRLAVTGEVRAPGFVYVPGEALLSEVITAAGGPTVNGSLSHASMRRAGTTVMNPPKFGRALASGATLADLAVQAGDEVRIEPVASRNWTQAIQTVAIAVGAAAAVMALRAGH